VQGLRIVRSDEQLMLEVRRGDLRAFDELYARYERRLFGYVVRTLRHRALAEDVFQDVFMEVLRKGALELREGQFAGWLFTVARNRCLDELRKQARPPPEPEPLPESAGEDAEMIAARNERFALLQDALASLSEPHREVLLLKEVGGLTYRQIAEVQSVPEGTAKSRLHFAMRAVRSALGFDDGGDE
jgi:RNA polymerase sigma-70 factor (ECF subfamily)